MAKKKKALPPKVKKAVSWEMGELATPEPLPAFRMRGKTKGGTGVPAIDRTVQKTHIWLKELMQEMGWVNRERTFGALRAYLHAVRDILSTEEVVQFGAQLPILLRGAYYEGWNPNRAQMRIKSVSEFHDLVFFHLGAAQKKFSEEEIEWLVHAAFNVTTKHISAGEMLDVKAGLPKKLQGLIPSTLEWPRHRRLAA